MSGLFSSLSMAAQSLEAQRAGLDVAGQNIANLNTPGYKRRRLDLAEAVNGIGGVEVLGTRAARDAVLDTRVRTAIPDASREGAILNQLSLVETTIGAPGQGIDGRLSAFFDAFASLSVDPTSTVARDGVVLQGRELASAFTATATRLASSVQLADNGVRDAVGQVNSLSQQIAALNVAIAASGGTDVDALKDRQQLAVEQLSSLTSVAVLARPDGGVDVTIPSGRALVIGGSKYDVSASTGGNGLATLSLGGADITGELTSGTVGGLLYTRDTLIPGYRARLDQLAFGVAQEVNTLHQSGFDLNGNPGTAFFTPPAAVAGAAAAMTVSATVQGNPSLVAASQTGAPGDNQVARALANLRLQPVLSGGTTTFAEGWAQLAYQVGSDVDTARAEQSSLRDVLGQVQKLRDQVSGVSLDEEAASMMKFQRAYEANARFFTAVDSMLQTLMNTVGRG